MTGSLVLGRYRVGSTLGEGGAGTVFHATDEVDGGEVALKLFPAARSSAEEFRREAAAAMRTRHPNLVALIDAGVHERSPVLAFEYVPGSDGRERLDRAPFELREAVAIAIQVFAGLDAMHRRGLVHGDVKPENIRLQGCLARIVDFGRARLAHLLDGSGVFAGTPPYMHPQMFSSGGPTPRTDCFAAWLTAWELVMGVRPYTAGALRWADDQTLPARRPLPDPALDAIVDAGIRGRLTDARSGWLALKRWTLGRTSAAPRAPQRPPALSQAVDLVLARALPGRPIALTGDAAVARAALHAIHRRWEGGSVLWAHADWGSPDVPLSGALGLAGHAADALDGPALAEVARALGPLGPVLSQALPAVRAWIPSQVATLLGRPPAEQLVVALRQVLTACPQPLLVLVDGLDRLDGSSRRFLNRHAMLGEFALVASFAAGAPHGMAEEIAVEPVAGDPSRPDDEDVPARVVALVQRARTLGLPLGTELAAASGLSEAEIEDCALEAEASGLAVWNGAAVVPVPGPVPEDATAREWLRTAARNFDGKAQPLRVARWAARAGDAVRLEEVLDDAVDAAERLDPTVALELLSLDPRPPTSARRLRHLQIALLARDTPTARRLLAEFTEDPEVPLADRLEAEGDFAFRLGLIAPAVASYTRAAAELGRPMRTGLAGLVHDVLAVVRVSMGRVPRPRRDARLARIFEHLYDLHFTSDQRPLLRLHSMWLSAAPDDPRARAVELIWRTAFGKTEGARQLETQLLGELRDDTDPAGAAIVVCHRAMARLLAGDVVEAFADGCDSSQRLLRAGDPYLAQLASSVMWVAGAHLAQAPAMARNLQEVAGLVAATGDVRAEGWLEGAGGVLAWLVGDGPSARASFEKWAFQASQRGDSTEALARRYVAEVHLENGEWEQAMPELQATSSLVRRFHLQMDFVDAWAISAIVADAMARIEGRTGWNGASKVRKLAKRLVARSPRWGPRHRTALAYAAAADGDRAEAARLFESAAEWAIERHQTHDAWWALHMRGRALLDEAAFERAADLSTKHGLKVPRETP